ncbi:MAG: hypothetical protein JWP49_191 [Phenylobacterium sp.]|nr:hypothetical protein [Phenylobacterium sp.]
MIRVLAMIAVAGFLLSVACLSIAVSLAGPEAIASGAWAWSGPWNHHSWGHRHHGFGFNYSFSPDGPQASRELPWTGEALDVDVPAHVRFIQAPGPARLVIHGRKDAIDHVVVENGRIGLDLPNYDGEAFDIELTAPKVTRFGLGASGRLEIADFKQDDLDLRISGDGDVTAQGSAKSVKLQISGSGDADLAALVTDSAEVRISGSGQAKVGPKTSARLDISGSGGVTLTSRPARVESHVSGSGSIDQDDSAGAATPAEPSKPVKPAKAGKPV